MSHPSTPPAAGTPDPYLSSGAAAWTPPAAPSWAPAWRPPTAPVAPPGPAPVSPARGRSHLVPVLAGVGGLLAGAVLTGVVLSAVFAGSSAGLEQGIAGQIAGSSTDPFAQDLPDPGLIEKFDAVAPSALGSDPVLDRVAQDCFEGDLPACDDLYVLSTPMTGYERYAVTCGGRVREYSLLSCSDFE